MDAVLSTLNSLPGIASNPLAILAYIVVIGAWLLSYMRAARFKILMNQINALPEADRKAVLTAEMNTAIPNSISAEDWLRSKRQLYFIIAYVLTLIAVVLLLTLAYVNRGDVSIDAVGVKTGWLGIVGQAQAQAASAEVEHFQPRPDSTKHNFKFDLILRNSSDRPATVTNIVVTFDPDEGGFLSGGLEISNTYAVLLRTDGSGTVTSQTGEDDAKAWYPNTDGVLLMVKTPLQQTLPPLSADRFVVNIRFPAEYAFRGPMKKAKLSLTYNGKQKLETTVSLIP